MSPRTRRLRGSRACRGAGSTPRGVVPDSSRRSAPQNQMVHVIPNGAAGGVIPFPIADFGLQIAAHGVTMSDDGNDNAELPTGFGMRNLALPMRRKTPRCARGAMGCARRHWPAAGPHAPPRNQMVHVIPNGAAGGVRNLAVPMRRKTPRCARGAMGCARRHWPAAGPHAPPQNHRVHVIPNGAERSEESSAAHAPQDPALRAGCHGLLPAPLARRRAIRYAE